MGFELDGNVVSGPCRVIFYFVIDSSLRFLQKDRWWKETEMKSQKYVYNNVSKINGRRTDLRINLCFPSKTAFYTCACASVWMAFNFFRVLLFRLNVNSNDVETSTSSKSMLQCLSNIILLSNVSSARTHLECIVMAVLARFVPWGSVDWLSIRN